MGGDADMSDESFALHQAGFVHCSAGRQELVKFLLMGHVVKLHEVDVGRSQAQEAFVQVAAEDFGGACGAFGGNNERPAINVGNSGGNSLLAAAVAVGGIDKVYAAIDCSGDEFCGLINFEPREWNSAKSEFGDDERCFSETNLLHGVALSITKMVRRQAASGVILPKKGLVENLKMHVKACI